MLGILIKETPLFGDKYLEEILSKMEPYTIQLNVCGTQI